MWFRRPILLAIGQKPVVAALAQDYLRIAGFGLLPVLCGLTLNSYLAAMERTQVVLWITLAGLPVNVFLNWVLIFGNLGAPELGVRGAAIASVSVQVLQLVLLVGYAALAAGGAQISPVPAFLGADRAELKAVFLLGLPIGLTMVAEGGLFVASNVMMGWIGRRRWRRMGSRCNWPRSRSWCIWACRTRRPSASGRPRAAAMRAWMRDAGRHGDGGVAGRRGAGGDGLRAVSRQLVGLYLTRQRPQRPRC